MLKRYATFVTLFRFICDIFVIIIIWISMFYFRFYSGLFSVSKGVPDFRRHIILTVPIILICFSCFLAAGLYKPKRTQNMFFRLAGIFKATFFAGIFIVAFFYYIQEVPYSRKLLSLFIVTLFFGLGFWHLMAMAIIRRLRSKGFNLRYYAVIGVNNKGIQLVRDIEQMEWLGLKCNFFVDNSTKNIGKKIDGIPVYGPIENLATLVKAEEIDEIYLVLSGDHLRKIYPTLRAIQYLGIVIRILPDWGGLASINKMTTINIGSQILFSATDSPLSGVNMLLKEVFDRFVAATLLILLACPMALIAVLVKLSSPGSVFYRQKRVGMDLHEFDIIKFRTMSMLSSGEEELEWSNENNPRRTAVGRWLRRFSLDELPQLLNVLTGQMSLVGPRPERPVFAKMFSEEYKNYMLRHKVKTGITGWAQVHDLRGNTSLKKRLLYDMYYVRNWSFMLDIWILLQTPWHIIKGKNAS